MRRIWLSAAIAVQIAMVASGAAAAAETFTEFKKFCLDTDAGRESALAQADADHWIPVDPSKVQLPLQDGFQIDKVDLRAKRGEAGQVKMLMIGKGQGTPFPGVSTPTAMVMCGLFERPAAPEQDTLAQWAGVPPIQTGAQTLYAFTLGQGGHERIPMTAEASAQEQLKILKPLLDSGRIRVVGAGDLPGGGAALMFMALTGATDRP